MCARSVPTASPPNRPIIVLHTILCILRNPLKTTCLLWPLLSYLLTFLRSLRLLLNSSLGFFVDFFFFFLIISLCSLTLKSSILSLGAPRSPSALHVLHASLPPPAKVSRSWPFSSPAVRPGWGSWTMELLPCEVFLPPAPPPPHLS